tara:strand:+ start:1911 stop:2744 length:834 start_codon:yes stop_codon:yes gene_type:complete
MTSQIKKTIKTSNVSEGAGVTVYRSIGTTQQRNFDPFLMLDFFSSSDPNDYKAGFPDHPHRGFITLTYMLEGNILHQDSMGNKGTLTSGGAQWMKAGSGVIHSEMPQQEEGKMRGFQLWINLPREQKMTPPAYQEFEQSSFPIVEKNGTKVKILVGNYQGKVGPINDQYTNVSYFDVTLEEDKIFEISTSEDENTFIFVFEGEVENDNKKVVAQHLATFEKGKRIKLKSGLNGSRFIFASGKPLNEPIVQYGPFVMNTLEEAHQAVNDYKAGDLVKK